MAVLGASEDFGYNGGWRKIGVWGDLVVWISEMPRRILKRMVDSESSAMTLLAVKRTLNSTGYFWS